jgi:O-antigen/teichoic acid export membrane protein
MTSSDAPSDQRPSAENAEASAVEANVLASVRRRLLRGSGWVLLARVLGIPLGILINGLLARMLTKTEFGAYLTCFTLVIVGSLIAQLGLDRAVVRLVSQSLAIDEGGRARQTIRRTIRIGSVAAIIAGALLLIFGPSFARNVLHSEVVALGIPLTAGWLVAYSIQSLVVETFRGLQDFQRATVYDTILVDIAMAATFTAMWVFGTRQVGLLTVLGIVGAITALVTIVAGSLLSLRVRSIEGDGHLARGEVFAIAWPSLFTNVASYFLSTGIDVLILGAFRPQAQVAVYGAATRLVILVATPLWILRGVLPPMISELHARGRTSELERTLRAGATLAGLPSFVVLVVFLFFGGPVMGLAFGHGYASGATVLGLLAIGRMVAVWSGASGVTLLMTGHQKAMMTITLCTGVSSVIGEILVAPRFGAVGVATVTMSAAIVQNILQLTLVKHYLGVWSQMEFSPRELRRFFVRSAPHAPSGSRSDV